MMLQLSVIMPPCTESNHWRWGYVGLISVLYLWQLGHGKTMGTKLIPNDALVSQVSRGSVVIWQYPRMGSCSQYKWVQ